MSCTKPLRAFQIGYNLNGKKHLKVCSSKTDYISYTHGKYLPFTGKPLEVDSFNVIDEFIEIPCGKCISCRLKRSREWALRCMAEKLEHENSFFITLTYDDDHLPMNYYYDDNLGIDTYGYGTLVSDELSKFIKRVRTNYERLGYTNKLRFFGCGEYGSKGQRPHYHVIIFGLKLDDLKPAPAYMLKGVKHDKNFLYDYYTSDFIANCWQHRGLHIIGNVTYDSCAYTARYIVDKLNGDMAEIEYTDQNRIPPFVRMSRMPGIGKSYYDKYKDTFYQYDSIIMNGIKHSIPRYYDKLYDIEFPSVLSFIKDIRVNTAIDNLNNYYNSNFYYDFRLQNFVDENYNKNLIKSLSRDKF